MKTSRKCIFFSLPQKNSENFPRSRKKSVFYQKKSPKTFFSGKTVFLYNMTLLSSEKTKIPFFWRPSFIKNDAYIFYTLDSNKNIAGSSPRKSDNICHVNPQISDFISIHIAQTSYVLSIDLGSRPNFPSPTSSITSPWMQWIAAITGEDLRYIQPS